MPESSRDEGRVANRLRRAIEDARIRFRDLMRQHVGPSGASLVQYSRYLTMQYHLTREVQTYFIAAAGHRDLARRRALRKFLVNFANEEELHYLVAANDLVELGLSPGPIPIDVALWHTYFSGIVTERPFVRLGAACILESISGGEAKAEVKRALGAPFLTRANSKFLVLHQHETLPHGEQLLAALDAAGLEDRHLDDLAFGSSVGTVIYLRMAEWALDPNSLASLADAAADVGESDSDRIASVVVGANFEVSLS